MQHRCKLVQLDTQLKLDEEARCQGMCRTEEVWDKRPKRHFFKKHNKCATIQIYTIRTKPFKWCVLQQHSVIPRFFWFRNGQMRSSEVPLLVYKCICFLIMRENNSTSHCHSERKKSLSDTAPLASNGEIERITGGEGRESTRRGGRERDPHAAAPANCDPEKWPRPETNKAHTRVWAQCSPRLNPETDRGTGLSQRR